MNVNINRRKLIILIVLIISVLFLFENSQVYGCTSCTTSNCGGSCECDWHGWCTGGSCGCAENHTGQLSGHCHCGSPCSPCSSCPCSPPGSFSWNSPPSGEIISFDGVVLNWAAPGSWGHDSGKGDGSCDGCNTCSASTKQYKVYKVNSDDTVVDLTSHCTEATGAVISAADYSTCTFDDLDATGLRGGLRTIRIVAKNGCCSTSTDKKRTYIRVHSAYTTCDFDDCQDSEDTTDGYVKECRSVNSDGTIDYCRIKPKCDFDDCQDSIDTDADYVYECRKRVSSGTKYCKLDGSGTTDIVNCDYSMCRDAEDAATGYVSDCEQDGEYCKRLGGLEYYAIGRLSVNLNRSNFLDMDGSEGSPFIIEKSQLSYDLDDDDGYSPSGFGTHDVAYDNSLSIGDKIGVNFISLYNSDNLDKNLFIDKIEVSDSSDFGDSDTEVIDASDATLYICDMDDGDCQDSSDASHPEICQNMAGKYCPMNSVNYCVPDTSDCDTCHADISDCVSDFSDWKDGYVCEDTDGEVCKSCVPDTSDCQEDKDEDNGYVCLNENSDNDSGYEYCQTDTSGTDYTCPDVDTFADGVNGQDLCKEDDMDYHLAWEGAAMEFTLTEDRPGATITGDDASNVCPNIERDFDFNDYPECSISSAEISAGASPRFDNDSGDDDTLPSFEVSHLGEVELTLSNSDPDGDTVIANRWSMLPPYGGTLGKKWVGGYWMSSRGKGWDIYDTGDGKRLLEVYLRDQGNNIVMYRWCDFNVGSGDRTNCTGFYSVSAFDNNVRYRDVGLSLYSQSDGSNRFFQSVLHDDSSQLHYRDCGFNVSTGGANCGGVTAQTIDLSKLCVLDGSGDCSQSLLDISDDNVGVGHTIYSSGGTDKIHLGFLDWNGTAGTAEYNSAICDFDRANGDFVENGSGNVSCELVEGNNVGALISWGMFDYQVNVVPFGDQNFLKQSFLRDDTLREDIHGCWFNKGTHEAYSCTSVTEDVTKQELTNTFYGNAVVPLGTDGTITAEVVDQHGLSNTCEINFQTTNVAPELVSVSPSGTDADSWSGTLSDDDNHSDTSVCTDKNPQVFTATFRDLDGFNDIQRAGLWMSENSPDVRDAGTSARGTIIKGTVITIWASGTGDPAMGVFIDQGKDGVFSLSDKVKSITVGNDWASDNPNMLPYSVYYYGPLSSDQVMIWLEDGTDKDLYIEKIELNGVDIDANHSGPHRALKGTGNLVTFNKSHAPIFRFYKKEWRDHLFTTRPYEAAILTQDDSWTYEGITGFIQKFNATGRSPVYRVFNDTDKDHMLTSSETEKDNLIADGWVGEGVHGFVHDTQVSGSSPLYRLYSSHASDHMYTANASARNNAIVYGWTDEGITGYIYKHYPDPGNVEFGSTDYNLYGMRYDDTENAVCGVDGDGDDITDQQCWRNYDIFPSTLSIEVGDTVTTPAVCSASTVDETNDLFYDDQSPYASMGASCNYTNYGAGFTVTEIRTSDSDSDEVIETMEVDYKFWFNKHPDNLLDIGRNLDIYGLVNDNVGARDGWEDIGDWNLDFSPPVVSTTVAPSANKEIKVTWNSSDAADESGVLESLGYGSFNTYDGLTGGTGKHSGTDKDLGHKSLEHLWTKSGAKTAEEEIIDISNVSEEDSGEFEFEIESADNACNMDNVVNTDVELGVPWMMTQGGFVHSGSDVDIPVPDLDNKSENIHSDLGDEFKKGEIQISTEMGSVRSDVLQDIIDRTDDIYENYNMYTILNYNDDEQKEYTYDKLYEMTEQMYAEKSDEFQKGTKTSPSTLTGKISEYASDACSDPNKLCWLNLEGSSIVEITSKLTCDRQTVLFIDADLDVNNEVVASGNINGCIFVVKGNIKFEYAPTDTGLNYDQIDGFFISDQSITIEDDDNDNPNGILVRGGLLAYTTSGEPGATRSVEYERGLGLFDNLEYPSLVVSHDSRYTILGGKVFKDLDTKDVYKKNEGFKPY